MSYNITGALSGGNAVLSRAGGATANLAASTTTFTTQNLTFANQGKLYYKAGAAQTNPTTDYNTGAAFKAQAAGQACAYVFGVTSGGTFVCMQGPLPVQAGTVGTVTNVDAAGNVVTAPQFPSVPDAVTPIAYAIAVNATTGSAWTVFSTSVSATGMTFNLADVFTMPASPQVS